MNYKDYLEIMKAEELEETEEVKVMLRRAMHWNAAAKRASVLYNDRIAKQLDEERVKAILDALDVARYQKQGKEIPIFLMQKIYCRLQIEKEHNDLNRWR